MRKRTEDIVLLKDIIYSNAIFLGTKNAERTYIFPSVLIFVVLRTEKVNCLSLCHFIELCSSFSLLQSLYLSHCFLFKWRKYMEETFLKGRVRQSVFTLVKVRFSCNPFSKALVDQLCLVLQASCMQCHRVLTVVTSHGQRFVLYVR